MFINKWIAFFVLLVVAVFPKIIAAQEIKGDTIYASASQQTNLYFPSTVTAGDYADKTGYSNFEKRIEASIVSIRAKVKNAAPTVLNVTEGGRTHSFVITYKDFLSDKDLNHEWSDLKVLNDYVARINRKKRRCPWKNRN